MKKSILTIMMFSMASIAVANPLVGDINNTTNAAGNNAAILANDLRNSQSVNDNNFNNHQSNISANTNANNNSAVGNHLKDSGNSNNTNTLQNNGNSSVRDSGNSHNTNALTNTGGNSTNTLNNNTSLNNDLSNSGNSVVGVNAGNLSNVGNASSNQDQNQSQSNEQGQSQSSETNVNVQGDNITYEASRIPVASAYAAPIYPSAVCMGSSSAGGQGMTFGLSVATSWTDENCMALEQIRYVSSLMNDTDTAAMMMCVQFPLYREAREKAGNPCMDDTDSIQTKAGTMDVRTGRTIRDDERAVKTSTVNQGPIWAR